MGSLYVRVGPGSYSSTQAPDRMVVYLFNSGMKTWTIGPTTEERSETGARELVNHLLTSIRYHHRLCDNEKRRLYLLVGPKLNLQTLVVLLGQQ
jgi:hypothetical protein